MIYAKEVKSVNNPLFFLNPVRTKISSNRRFFNFFSPTTSKIQRIKISKSNSMKIRQSFKILSPRKKIIKKKKIKPKKTPCPLVILNQRRNLKLSSNDDKNITNSSTNAKNENVFKNYAEVTSSYNRNLYDVLILVSKAKVDQKTFSVAGNFTPLRNALISRGWLEKMITIKESDNFQHLKNMSYFTLAESITKSENGEKYKRTLISRLLSYHQVDFFWDFYRKPFSINSDQVKQTIINKYPAGKSPYASKIGLTTVLKESYCELGLKHVLYPRAYNLADSNEMIEFVKDFQMTAVISLINWVSTASEDNIMYVESICDKTKICVFDFALDKCQDYLRPQIYKEKKETIRNADEQEWKLFLENFYKITKILNHIPKYIISPPEEYSKIFLKVLVHESKSIIKNLEGFRSTLYLDGYMNLWIAKPHHGSLGHGIVICQTLKDVVNVIQNNPDKQYVVQKYIERPLLIYNTKFDIRQWFLIAHRPEFHIWMFRDFYLRFSSQTYNLNEVHESIHLTNHSVQSKYKSSDKNRVLPNYYMWHSQEFENYLLNTRHPLALKEIYKRMKDSFVEVFMCCSGKISERKNSFEVLGADFILTEEFEPYLIEINRVPDLSFSTPVTTKLCTELLEDIVKVIIDYAQDPNADTGKFELIYKDNTADTCYEKNCKNMDTL